MYNCILFDIDGTIMDTKYPSLLAAQAAVEEILGKKYPITEFEFTFGIPTEKIGKRFGIENCEEYVKKVDEHYEIYSLKHSKLFDGMLETIKTLSDKNINRGIVTSKTKWEFEFEFGRFDLIKYFPHHVYFEMTKKHKPHGEPIEKFFEISQIKDAKAIYIGDTCYDYECAKEAKVDFAFANWSGGEAIDKGNIILNHPKEILGLL